MAGRQRLAVGADLAGAVPRTTVKPLTPVGADLAATALGEAPQDLLLSARSCRGQVRSYDSRGACCFRR